MQRESFKKLKIRKTKGVKINKWIKCFGSAKFWFGSGSAKPLPGIVDTTEKNLKDLEISLTSRCLTRTYKKQVILHELLKAYNSYFYV